MRYGTKGFRAWYSFRLSRLARAASGAVRVVSDGDLVLVNRAWDDAMQTHRWWPAGTNAKGQDVFFCWTVRKDSMGHFRSWREVHTSKEIKRYDMAWFKTSAPARELARVRYNKFIGERDE